jgi:hypothetical protein
MHRERLLEQLASALGSIFFRPVLAWDGPISPSTPDGVGFRWDAIAENDGVLRARPGVPPCGGASRPTNVQADFPRSTHASSH